jgi:hypothetical protein
MDGKIHLINNQLEFTVRRETSIVRLSLIGRYLAKLTIDVSRLTNFNTFLLPRYVISIILASLLANYVTLND